MGTGPCSHSSSVSRVCFVRCKKFEGNFTMALCSFGGISYQWGATSWAAHEEGMVPLLSCKIDMTRSPSGACNFHTASVKRRFHK